MGRVTKRELEEEILDLQAELTKLRFEYNGLFKDQGILLSKAAYYASRCKQLEEKERGLTKQIMDKDKELGIMKIERSVHRQLSYSVCRKDMEDAMLGLWNILVEEDILWKVGNSVYNVINIVMDSRERLKYLQEGEIIEDVE